LIPVVEVIVISSQACFCICLQISSPISILYFYYNSTTSRRRIGGVEVCILYLSTR